MGNRKIPRGGKRRLQPDEIGHAPFADASKADAVLFWDEADSLFYQREDTSRAWEVSSVNTLLQEQERFALT